jgi:hypothetical protein
MGFPTAEDNLENYRKSSTLDKVKYLNGKKFLIMFGTADGICSTYLLNTRVNENFQESHIFMDFKI